MPAIRRRWTAAQVRSLIDQAETAWPRYELLDGELMVTPAPGGIHQVAVAAIVRLLQSSGPRACWCRFDVAGGPRAAAKRDYSLTSDVFRDGQP